MNTPEELFREKFDGFQQKPPEELWLNIERRLAKKSFWNFDFKTFNVWYLAAVLAAGTFTAVNYLDAENSHPQIETVSKSRYVYSGSTRKVLINNQNNTAVKNSDKVLPEIKTDSPEVFLSDAGENYTVVGTTVKNDTNVKKDSKVSDIEIPDFTSYFKMSSVEGCAPFTVKFTNLSKNTEYCYWNFGNGEVSYDQNGVATYLSPGAYYVTLKTVNGTFSKVYSDTVRVYARPQAQIAYVKSSKTIIAEARNSKSSSFIWDFSDGKKSVGEKVTHTYANYGTYPLKLVITNGICVDTVKTDIQLSLPEYSITFPNAFTVSSSGAGSGISYSGKEQFSVFYPKGDVDKLAHYSLKILNRNGKEVFFTTDVQSYWDGYFRNERLPKGVYVYSCQYEFFNGERGTLTGNITLMWED